MPTAFPPVSQSISSPLKAIDELMSWSHLHGKTRLGDALLEMRAAYRRVEIAPEALCEAFLRNRRILAKHDYLWSHRFRRWLENSFQLVLETPGNSRRMPLDLTWSSMEKVFNQARREHFEYSDENWNDLAPKIEPCV